MSWDEAEKAFPQSKPAPKEYGPPKPKQDAPQPLRVEKIQEFAGVVGRASIPIAARVENPNTLPVAISARISGHDFSVWTEANQIAGAGHSEHHTDLRLQYTPSKPGKSTSILELLTRFEDSPYQVQHIPLVAEATKLEHPTPAPADGSARPIPDLGVDDARIPTSKQPEHDLDVLSGIGETYQQMIANNDGVYASAFGKLSQLSASFDRDVREWVEAETSHKTSHKKAPEIAALIWKAAEAVVNMGVEALEIEGPPGKIVGMLVEYGMDKLEEHFDRNRKKSEAKEEDERNGTAEKALLSENASQAINSVDKQVRSRCISLITAYAGARERLRSQASNQIMLRERNAQKAMKGGVYEHDTTVAQVNFFKNDVERYSDAARNIVDAVNRLEPQLDASFQKLKMKYLATRGGAKGDDPFTIKYNVSMDLGGDMGHERFRAFEPEVSGYKNEDWSEQMRDFIVTRKLSDLSTEANVWINLHTQSQGSVVVTKLSGKAPALHDPTGPAGVRAVGLGADRLWQLLELSIG